MKKHYLKISITIALVLILSLIWVNPAHAFLGIGSFTAGAINFVLGSILNFFTYVAGLILTLAAFLTNWSLNLNSLILGTDANPNTLVQTGWAISRDLANLGFVLAIILISFATILRIQTYEAKKLISRLVIAALLVNFSLVIAGVFIDFSGMLTNFFLNAATGNNPAEFATGMQEALGTHRLMDTSKTADDIKTITAGATAAFMQYAASLAFIIFFTLCSAIAFLGLAIMFLIRYITLTILLIVAPLAWAFWVLPDLEHLWKKWWSEFMRWIFFAPAASFFLYMAFKLATQGSNLALNDPQGALSAGLIINNFGQTVGKMIAVIGLLIGGLIAADKVGKDVGVGTLNMAKGASKMVTGGTAKLVGGGFRQASQLGYKPETIDPKTGQRIAGGGWLQRQTARFTGIPLVGGAARTVNQWAATSRESQKETFSKELTELAKDKTAFINAGKDPLRMKDDAFASQYVKVAAEKGMLKDMEKYNPDALKAGVQAARREGSEKELYKKNPSLAKMARPEGEDPNIARTEVRSAVNGLSVEDLNKLSAENFETPEIAFGLSNAHLKHIAQNATLEQEEALERTLEKWKKEIPATDAEKGGAEWESLSPELKVSYRRGITRLDNMRNNNPASQVPKQPQAAKPTLLSKVSYL